MKTHAYTNYSPDKTDLLSVCPHQEAQKVSLSCPLYDQPGGFCVEFMPEEPHIRILRRLVDELVTMKAAREFRERQQGKKAAADRAADLTRKNISIDQAAAVEAKSAKEIRDDFRALYSNKTAPEAKP